MKCKLIFTIIDGFGIEKNSEISTIKKANPKFFNFLTANYPYLELDASGKYVGLEANQSGNSEVGHITIGSGRTFDMGKKMIDNNLGEIKKKLIPFLKKAIKQKNNIHLIGMPSTGLIHSCEDHLYFLIDLCNQYKIKPILHLFLDGRDCAKKDEFKDTLDFIKQKYIKNNLAFIGTLSGRKYAMDRNENWNLTIKVFEKMTQIASGKTTPFTYIDDCYKNSVYDEFIEPISFNNAQTTIQDNDIFIAFNYRSDRMRQICHLLKPSNCFYYKHDEKYNLKLITFTDYKLDNVDCVCVPFPKIDDYLGKVLSDNNYSQLRIAETEKYAHVTYYFDCMNLNRVNNCDAVLIPSPNVFTYDLKPKMNARFVTKEVLSSLDKYDIIIINYANTDMVGHTGNLKASIKSIKYIDKQLKRIYNATYKNLKIPIVITSDHGNVEKIVDENGIIYTNHTSNKVPFVFVDNKVKLNSVGGSLANIAPTILEYLNIRIPKNMSRSLLKS